MDGEGQDEVVRGRGGGAEVEEAEVRVAGYGGEEGGRVRGEGGGVGAGVDGEGDEGGGAGGVPLWFSISIRGAVRAVEGGRWGFLYHSDSTVPRAGAECILRYQVPMHGEDFSHVLFPGFHGELVDADVEELDRAIAGGD